MIVWLASYPRSGNTFLRIALNRVFGVRSSVIYDHDGVADRLGAKLVGFEERLDDLAAIRAAGEIVFIKTHRQRDHRIGEEDAAICLVRDGRDALVSYACQLSEEDSGEYEAKLRELIANGSPTGTGSWGDNVLGWLQHPLANQTAIKFEDLVSSPVETVQRAVTQVAPLLRPHHGASVPTFDALADIDGRFFRRGQSGSWRAEMPAQLHDMFWTRPENRTAMDLLGYA